MTAAVPEYRAADPSDATAVDNVRRWDGASTGHYEVWYVTLNHRESSTGYWIRYTMEAPVHGHGAPYAQLWFACFDRNAPSRTFAINQIHPIGQMVAHAAPFSVRIGDAEITHRGARGAIKGGGHDVSWDLRWLPSLQTHRQLPSVMYKRGGVGDTTVLTPNIDVPIRGTITVDGTPHELAGDPGGQTHLWGRKHAHSWAWGHCNAFEGRRGAALEALTVRLKKRGRVLPPLTIFALYLDGEVYRWNEFQHTLLARGDYSTGRYAFRGRRGRVRVEGEYTCRPEDMVVAQYADPDGEPSWCANTEVADLRVTVWKRAGVFGRWREHARLVAAGTGHFEVGGRTRDPAVEKDHVTV
jgi:hypothetical protein